MLDAELLRGLAALARQRPRARQKCVARRLRVGLEPRAPLVGVLQRVELPRQRVPLAR